LNLQFGSERIEDRQAVTSVTNFKQNEDISSSSTDGLNANRSPVSRWESGDGLPNAARLGASGRDRQWLVYAGRGTKLGGCVDLGSLNLLVGRVGKQELRSGKSPVWAGDMRDVCKDSET